MLETIKYATISNIYIKKLIFYDYNKEKELIALCNSYGITYLPGKDRESCYQLINDKFVESKIREDLICNPYDRIFDDSTLAKFESGNHDEVMFVMEENKIRGVVHIVDYNNDFINFEFFKATYQFEKMLRELLILKEESNESLLEWMRIKAMKNSFWKKRHIECVPTEAVKLKKQDDKRRDCNPFQTFFLNDLLFFVASKKYISVHFRKSLEAIRGVRNWVAHNKDLAHKSEGNDFPLYKIDELKKFVINTKDFFKCYEELEMLIDLNKKIDD